MPRFYCPGPLIAGATVDLPEALAHHLHVVRQQAGDEIVLFNGAGGQYRALVAEVGKKRASATIVAHEAVELELPYSLTLAQALPEASKMDWIIEKAVELGVTAIQPLAAQRCVVRLSGERAEKRHAHWQAVIVAASEQSGRNRLAQLAPVEEVGRWAARPAGAASRILLSPRATRSLAAWVRDSVPHALALMIGPEGGYTAREEAEAIAHGAVALAMGPRILRTETAGLAALAAVNAAWGGF